MTVYATADELLVEDVSNSTDEEDLTLSTGKTIRLRGLSRHALFFNGKGTDSPEVIESRNLVSCLVKPTMTKDQAEEFMRRVSAGDGHLISQKIRELSGLGEGAAKSPVVEVRD